MKLPFKTRKLGGSIRRITTRSKAVPIETSALNVYGVTNEQGVVITGKDASKDLSNYIVVSGNQFVYNPYRVNVGSIGLTPADFSGLVSPAYVVFETLADLDSAFLLHYLKSQIGIDLIRWYGNRGGVRSALRYQDLEKLEIPDLSLEQQKVARYRLSAFQDLTNKFVVLSASGLENVSALRQSILQLAVMGRLVPQDAKDGPASVLLEKIAAEKERLISEGKIKKSKPLPPIEPDEVAYELPEGWQWVRLIQLCAVITKGSSPKWQGVQYVDQSDGVLFITSENVGSMRMLMENRKYVQKKFNDIEPRSILRKDDILMNIVGASIGRVAVFDLDEVANINQAVCLIRCIQPNRLTDLGYLLLFLNSAICTGYMFSKQVDMARANLSMGNIAKFAIPLPPLAEQKRIVAKVDELMVLCDELQSKLQESLSAGEKLMAAVVNQIAMAQDEGTVHLLPINDSKEKIGQAGSRIANDKPRVSIDDLETGEVMAAFRKACRGGGAITREELFKEVSTLFKYQRLGSTIQERLKGHLRAAIRRKIIGTNGNEVWLETPTMDDYERADLVSFLGSVTQWDKEYDREEVIRALANYLGFRRLTYGVQGPIKSAINSAIRQGNIVATGPTIRRII